MTFSKAKLFPARIAQGRVPVPDPSAAPISCLGWQMASDWLRRRPPSSSLSYRYRGTHIPVPSLHDHRHHGCRLLALHLETVSVPQEWNLHASGKLQAGGEQAPAATIWAWSPGHFVRPVRFSPGTPRLQSGRVRFTKAGINLCQVNFPTDTCFQSTPRCWYGRQPEARFW